MLTAIILTKNEEKNIERCIGSLGFCDEIVVVDDGSVDDTVKIAKKWGAKVIGCKMQDFSSQRNWAIEQVKSNWILFVDADEVVTPELGVSIQEQVLKNDANGYRIHRVDYIWNHKFKYGDVSNVWLLRLARWGAGIWRGVVHETWQVDGRVSKLTGVLNHYPHQSVVEFLQKLNRYSTFKADEFYQAGRKTNIIEIIFGPICRFVYLFICKLGLLDGTAGFIHAVLMSFYVFLVAGKLYLKYNNIHANRQTQSNQTLA